MKQTMKKAMRNLFLFSLFALVLTGCSKDDDAVMDDSYSVDQKIPQGGIDIEYGGTNTTGNGGAHQTGQTAPLYRWDLPGKNHFYSRDRYELYTREPFPNPTPYPYNTYPYNDPSSPYYIYYPITYTWSYANHTPYRYEGIAFSVFKNAAGGLVPFYRYYNASSVDHMLTVGTSELGANGGNGWRREGIVGYIYPKNSQSANKGAKIYRYYNPKASDHFYTTNYSELGGGRGDWKLEGVIGYAAK